MIQGQQVAQERETEQIIGQVTGIVQKGPDKWQAVVVPDGSQYPKNLWTKDAGLIASLSSMIGQRLGFSCNVSHWNMQDGTPVRSLWIDSVGAPTADSPAMQGPSYVERAQQAQQNIRVQPQVIQAGAAAISPEVKEQRIHRQTASKVAAILLSNLPPEQRSMDALLQLSERLVAYYMNGLPPRTLDDEITRAMPQDLNEMYQGSVEPPPDWHDPDDDSIPF
jgi:hypothetical protein